MSSHVVSCLCRVQLISLVDLLFSEEKQRKSRSWGERVCGGKLGVKGGETSVGIYCMKEEQILERKKKVFSHAVCLRQLGNLQ